MPKNRNSGNLVSLLSVMIQQAETSLMNLIQRKKERRGSTILECQDDVYVRLGPFFLLKDYRWVN